MAIQNDNLMVVGKIPPRHLPDPDHKWKDSASNGPNLWKYVSASSTFLTRKKLIPIIDRTYPLVQLIKAIHNVEGGHKRGKVVVI